MTDIKGASERPPLYTFSETWELDGQHLRCRCCQRVQIISCALHDFEHALNCDTAGEERNPWKTLASLITAQVAKAAQPAEADSPGT